jgi:hypothetical protein
LKIEKYFWALIFFIPFSSFSKNTDPVYFSLAPPVKISFPVPGSIILFYNSRQCASCNQKLEIYVLTPIDGSFERVYVGALDTDGDPPVVESVFLGDGKGVSGDLFVLVSWNSNHPDAGIYTKNYAVYVFGRERDGESGLKRLRGIESAIGQTSEGTVEGKDGRPEQVLARYKNAYDVRRILKNIGQ